MTARLPEAYQWLIVPVQSSPQSEIEWQAFRLAAQDGLAVRASKELRKRDLLLTQMAGTVLRMELDKVPLWRGDHVEIRQLVDDFGRYVYLPRLADPHVLVEAVRDGLSLLTWERETFAYADSFDEAFGRYRALRAGAQLGLDGNAGLLVKPEAQDGRWQRKTRRAQRRPRGLRLHKRQMAVPLVRLRPEKRMAKLQQLRPRRNSQGAFMAQLLLIRLAWDAMRGASRTK